MTGHPEPTLLTWIGPNFLFADHPLKSHLLYFFNPACQFTTTVNGTLAPACSTGT